MNLGIGNKNKIKFNEKIKKDNEKRNNSNEKIKSGNEKIKKDNEKRNNSNENRNTDYKWLYKNNKKLTKVKIANTYFSRLIGLMFKNKIDYPLVFDNSKLEYCNKFDSSIHSYFMKLEISIVFVGENDEVFEIINLKPWKFHMPSKGAKYVIEFDKNEFEKLNLKINDEIKIV